MCQYIEHKERDSTSNIQSDAFSKYECLEIISDGLLQKTHAQNICRIYFELSLVL